MSPIFPSKFITLNAFLCHPTKNHTDMRKRLKDKSKGECFHD